MSTLAAPLAILRKENIMPLVYVTLAKGTTSQDQRTQIADGIYRAMVDVADVPEGDRFQVINEIPSANLIYSPDYLGFDRSPSVVFIQIFFNAGRSVDVKRNCTRGSPKIWARPGCVPTTFSSTSSKWPKRTGRSAEVSSAIHPSRLRARQ
ncbi:MAG: tautomerase family protein [Mycobacterium sp.]